MVLALLLPGCSMFQQDAKADGDQIAQDGTVLEDGAQVYVDKDGKSTALAVDPDTGEKNEKFKRIDEKKVENIAQQAETAAGWLPWGIGATIVGLISAGGIGAVRKRNAQADFDAGVKTRGK
jgi:hypothetical protein